MIDHSLRVALCRSITARAHLAGAEAAELEARFRELDAQGQHEGGIDGVFYRVRAFECADAAAATRRRYWREVSAAARLSGMPWPEAEALGAEQ
jgi:hypothetical protein